MDALPDITDCVGESVALTPSFLDLQVINDGKKKALDAWGASGGMPRIKA